MILIAVSLGLFVGVYQVFQAGKLTQELGGILFTTWLLLNTIALAIRRFQRPDQDLLD